MIPQSTHDTNWQHALANAIKSPDQLLEQLQLTDHLNAIDAELIKQFPLRVPQAYVDKMQIGDANDPLLRQVFPLIDEAFNPDHFVADPVGDALAISSPGVLQKYHGRALLLTTGACAIHCRYCFRRHFPYGDSNPLASQWQETIVQLQNDHSVNEVILSGGDPLALSDEKLSKLVADISLIPHIKRLRIHTRLPVVLPQRIDEKCITWIQNTRLQVVMVIHANHANELDKTSSEALYKLDNGGCQLLNQAVLLKGINDSETDLVNLSERLFELNVMPYYLHLLDRVKGASHFEVSEQTGIDLINAIRKKLPGYLVPRLVREQQGEASKTVIC
jgi:EF-P beta-lysylation protein EpmB